MTLVRTLAPKALTFGSCLAAAAAAATTLAAMTPLTASAGTVTILSQSRQIDASATFRPDADAQRKTAPDAGVFNETATAQASRGDTARTVASMNSHLGQDGLFMSGVVSFDVTGTGDPAPESSDDFPKVLANVTYGIEFSIDAAYHYDFVVDNKFSGDIDVPGDGQFFLSQLDGGSGGGSPNSSGILQPGRYSFNGGFTHEKLVGDPFTFEDQYDIHLALSPVSGGGDNGNGGGTPAVPLPPAVWSGALVLGAGALNRLRKRRAAV
jgi:hypothetical protein